jgi:hypothetical protein
MAHTTQQSGARERIEHLQAGVSAQAADLYRVIDVQLIAWQHFQEEGLKPVERGIHDERVPSNSIGHAALGWQRTCRSLQSEKPGIRRGGMSASATMHEKNARAFATPAAIELAR